MDSVDFDIFAIAAIKEVIIVIFIISLIPIYNKVLKLYRFVKVYFYKKGAKKLQLHPCMKFAKYCPVNNISIYMGHYSANFVKLRFFLLHSYKR